MTDDVVKLGLMPPLSGLVGLYGEEIVRAGRIACQEINEGGGVLGRPLELVIEDDGSLPDSAVAAANRLLDEHRCAALVGNLLSNSRIAVAYRVAEPRRVPYLNFSFYEGSILSRYFFHFAALPNQQIDRMILLMRERFGPRMFFAGSNYEWPRGSIDAAKRVLTAIDGVVAGEEYCPIGVSDEDIETLLDHVEAAAPDVFVPYFAGDDQLNLLTRFTARGMKRRMAVVMGHFDELLASRLPPDVRAGFHSCNTYYMGVDTPENRDFLRRLAAWPGVDGVWPHGNGILTNFGEGAYLCVKAFALAANRAGSLDAEALVEALATVELAGPQGAVRMDPATHHARVNAYLTQCREDGGFDIVESFGAIAPVLPERYRHLRMPASASAEDIHLQARMLDQMSEAVMLFRASDATIIYANPGAERMFGYGRSELIGRPKTMLCAPLAGQTAAGFLDQVARQGNWQGEVRNLRKDGAILWTSASISAFTHPIHGEVWMAVHKDVTQLKTLQQELRESEKRLTYALEATGEGVWDWDIPRNTVRHNTQWCRLLGLGETYLEHPLEAFAARLHAEDRAAVMESVRRAVAEDGNYFSTHRMVRSDGSEFWVEDRGRVVERGADGRALRMVGSVRDITERKLAEAEIRRLNADLERRVIERTAELDAARKEAERLARAKSDFLANMSHEIRTPMNAIVGMTELCMATRLDARQQGYLARIVSASGSLLRLIDDILDFSKIEAGKLDMASEPFRLAEAFDAVHSILNDKARAKGLELVVPKGGDLPAMTLMGDLLRLEQVLVNLVGNAIKFSDRGRVTVDAEVESRRDGWAELRFSVRDEGIGIDPEMQSRLFEPFTQADSSVTRRHGGTGLGLAISRRLVDLMGGRLWMESAPGQGSTFRFTAFFGTADVPSVSGAPKRMRAAAAEIPANLRGARVLMVEDNEIGQAVMREMLDLAGLEVQVAANGQEALDAVGAKRPDCVLMDCQMPVMDGFEATRRLRADARYLDLPIVALTANAMPGDRERCMTAGMNAFLAKPVLMAELFDELARWIPPSVGERSAPDRALRDEAPPLPDLPGIDAAAGVRHSANKPSLYLKLLHRFRDTRAMDFAQGFEAARRSNDWGAARRLAHSLKGSALTIGAGDLGELAARLEEAAAAADPAATAERLVPLSAELERVLAMLGEIAPPPAMDESKGDADIPVMEEGAGEARSASLLVVDDDPGVIELLGGILRPAYRVRFALSGEEALAQAREEPPGLILLDGLMPGMDGYEVCRRLKAAPRTHDIPVIFLTASNDPLDEQRGLDAGAVDYIRKPPNPPLVLQRVRIHLELHDQNMALEARVRERTRQLETEIAERRQTEDRVRHLTQHDALTGLANRDLLMDRLEQAIILSRRADRRVAVILLGLDRFNLINDSLGHSVGDALLREIGGRLSGYIRPGDTVARLGGDQFILVLSDLATESDATPLARGLIGIVSAPVEVAGQPLIVSASLGVAIFPKDGELAASLLKNADAAMHRAKELGRNCIQFYAPEMNARMLERLELETGLRRAIEKQEFVLHYQPKVDLSSGNVVGAEALIRWRHPSIGMVSPGDFIPLAEETGLIVPIGEWVIETACDQLKSWQAEGFADLCLSVNLSARQFQQENLIEVVIQALRVNDLQAQHLEIEVTESAVMRKPEEAIDILRRLKDIGIRISLDDFGTGYSSLNYLKRLPIDALKVDQSFVREIVSNPEDLAIASSVISLAHSLRHRVVAEGVETRAQLSLLRRQGCDYMQGYYFSRPVPAEEFAQLLRAGRTLEIDRSGDGGEERTLLLVDDEENVLKALRRVLRLEGYRILVAGSAAEALELLALHDVQVILSDQRMPEMGGIELLERAKDMYPETMRLVLSGYTELKSITDAINRGAIYKFLAKPWDDHSLREHIREAFLLHETRRRKPPPAAPH